MKPGKLDLPTIWRGCDWGPVTLKWKNQNGDPINLTGWQAIAKSLKVDLNPSITDGECGVTQLSLTKWETAVLRLGVENWDWIWQRPEGQYRFPPFLAGKVAIKEPVSSNGSLPVGVEPPDPPVAIAASALFHNRFHANWMAAPRATGYRLDVATDTDFTHFVPGFQDHPTGNVTTYLVDGLSPSTTYHYRLRARNTSGTSHNSNVIHVTTEAAPIPVNDNFLNRIRMEGLSGSLIDQSNVGATRETGEPPGEGSVWYRWNPNLNAAVGIAISTTVNRISVYTGSALNELDHVADSTLIGGRPVATFVAAPQITYQVRVYRNTGAAPFTLEWDYGR